MPTKTPVTPSSSSRRHRLHHHPTFVLHAGLTPRDTHAGSRSIRANLLRWQLITPVRPCGRAPNIADELSAPTRSHDNLILIAISQVSKNIVSRDVAVPPSIPLRCQPRTMLCMPVGNSLT